MRDCVFRSAACIVAPAALAAVVLAGCSARGDVPAKSAPPAEVTVLRAQPQTVTLVEEYVGQAEAVETVEIRSRVQGLLERQAFRDGAAVRRGQLLFRFARRPFAAGLDQAKANWAQPGPPPPTWAQNRPRVPRRSPPT